MHSWKNKNSSCRCSQNFLSGYIILLTMIANKFGDFKGLSVEEGGKKKIHKLLARGIYILCFIMRYGNNLPK